MSTDILSSPGPAGLAVYPLDLHLVNVGSIPTGPTHGEGRLQPHPGEVLKSTPNVRKSPRSGLNLEGRLSNSRIFSYYLRHHGHCIYRVIVVYDGLSSSPTVMGCQLNWFAHHCYPQHLCQCHVHRSSVRLLYPCPRQCSNLPCHLR